MVCNIDDAVANGISKDIAAGIFYVGTLCSRKSNEIE